MLTPKQERFVSEYLCDLNATQAAIRAGYRKKAAYATGAENLRKPEVAEAIEKAKKVIAARVTITQDEVLREYKRIAFFDPAKLFDEEGNPVRIDQLDEDTRRAIAGLDVQEMYAESVNTGRIKKYKIASKLGALDSLAKHLGLLKDTVEHSGEVTVKVTGINLDV